VEEVLKMITKSMNEMRLLNNGDVLEYHEDGQVLLCTFVKLVEDTDEWFSLLLRCEDTVARNGVYVDGVPGEEFEVGGHPKYLGYWGWTLRQAK
jgi:hypothetical protein